MGLLKIDFFMDGDYSTPIEWQDIELEGYYGNSIQPQLTRDEFTFAGNDAQRILSWFSRNPLQGMPFEIWVTNKLKQDPPPAKSQIYKLTGCIDFLDGYRIIDPYRVQVKFKPDNGLELIDDKLKAVSFGYLAEGLDNGKPGKIVDSDYVNVPVVIKKKFDGVEMAFAALSLYLMSKEIIEFATTLKERALHAFELIWTAPLSKPAKAVFLIGFILLQIAYAAFMIIALIQMLKVIKRNLLPRRTQYKAMFERRMLERACEYFGLELDCDLPEIDYTVFMPSKTDDKVKENKRAKGIPNVSDYGYQLYEFVELILKKYYARSVKVGNKFIIRAHKSPFWIETSGYVMPSNIEMESYRFNLDEFKANRFISYQYDPSDDYTMPNQATKLEDRLNIDVTDYADGLGYEMITDLAFAINDQYKLNRGLDEIKIPQALGARRDKLSALEVTVKGVLVAADLVIKLFGGKPIAGKIEEHRGSLVISQPSFNIAKSIVIKGGIIPDYHREILSAKHLYEEYHSFKSFKTNSRRAQHKVYTGIKIPFDFLDHMATLKTGYFTTEAGQIGKILNLKWSLSGDFAIADFYIEEEYIKPELLTETPIET